MRGTAAEGGSRRRLIAGLLLGAGRSSRFGRQKLLELWQGEPMLRHATRTWVEAGVKPTIVVISGDPALREALRELPVRLIENLEPGLGISRSIALGLDAIDEAHAVLIGVADQPYLTDAALQRLVSAYRPGHIVVARYGDHEGTPAIFDRRFFDELHNLQGDRGGQLVVARHPDLIIGVDLPVEMGRDIDAPDQWPA